MTKEYDKELLKKRTTFHIPTWQFSEEDGIALIELCHKVKPFAKIIYEVGCWTGHSTYWLARLAMVNKTKVRVVDNFKGDGSFLCEYIKEHNFNVKEEFIKNMNRMGVKEYILLLEGNSLQWSRAVADKTIDFLFLDASHKYIDIKQDIDSWFPKIRKGGIMCGHDFESTEYDKAFIDLDEGYNGKHHGVIKAVTEKFNEVHIINNKIWWVQK